MVHGGFLYPMGFFITNLSKTLCGIRSEILVNVLYLEVIKLKFVHLKKKGEKKKKKNLLFIIIFL